MPESLKPPCGARGLMGEPLIRIRPARSLRARALARKLRAGRIRINGSPINPRAPHGGFKLSGIGREFGRYGIEEFLEYKAIG